MAPTHATVIAVTYGNPVTFRSFWSEDPDGGGIVVVRGPMKRRRAIRTGEIHVGGGGLQHQRHRVVHRDRLASASVVAPFIVAA